MATVGSRPSALLLDTKGLCFLCLEDFQAHSVEEEVPPNVVSLDKLSRYVKIDFKRVFTLSEPLNSHGLLEESELCVSLCNNCHHEVLRFLKFHRDLEVIKMQLTSCLESIQRKIANGEKDERLVTEYKRRLRDESVQGEVIDNLRKEASKCCLDHCRKNLPTVVVSRLDPSDIPTREPVENYSWENEDIINDSDVDSVKSEPISDDDQDCDLDTCEVTRGNSQTCEECGELSQSTDLCTQMKGCLSCRTSGPYECKLCDLQFPTYYILTLHSGAMHFDVPFLSVRKSTFPQELFHALVDLELNSVVKVHRPPIEKHDVSGTQSSFVSRIRPRYECAYCGFEGKRKFDTRSHLLQTHFEELVSDVSEMQENPSMELLQNHAALLEKIELKNARDLLKIVYTPQAINFILHNTPVPEKPCIGDGQKEMLEFEDLDYEIDEAEESEQIEVKCLIDLDSDEDEEENPDDVEIPEETRCVRGPKGDQIYPCEDCGKYIPLSSLAAHQRTHSAYSYLQSYSCDKCSDVFSNRSNFKKHMIMQHFDTAFLPLRSQKIPPEFFKALVDLQLNSAVTLHLIPDAERASMILKPSSKYRYDCSYCKSRFSFKATARNHLIRIHFARIRQDILEMQENPQLNLLRSHAARLTSSKEETARILQMNIGNEDKSDNQRGPLRAIIKTMFHRKNSRYRSPFSPNTVCNKCRIDLVTRQEYIKHVRLACSLNPYIGMGPPLPATPAMVKRGGATPVVLTSACPCCMKAFPNAEAMATHQLLQHPSDSSEGRDFKCDVCIKTFRFFFGYRIHLLTAHRLVTFTPFVPRTTTPKILKEGIEETVKTFVIDGPTEGQTKCTLCEKDFKKASSENHVILTHFDEVAAQLPDTVVSLLNNTSASGVNLGTIEEIQLVPSN